MKLTDKQTQRFVKFIFDELKAQDLITFKSKESDVFNRAIEIVKNNFREEELLDEEVNKMMDDLERQHSGEFQRYKMFPMLKKKLAQQKGFVLWFYQKIVLVTWLILL